MSEKYTPEPANKYKRKANWDHKYRHENMPVDMDVWYPILKSITFKTYFIPLNYREAEAIATYHDYRRNTDYRRHQSFNFITKQNRLLF